MNVTNPTSKQHQLTLLPIKLCANQHVNSSHYTQSTTGARVDTLFPSKLYSIQLVYSIHYTLKTNRVDQEINSIKEER